jgi:two-component system chemotaxis response regulator CheB
MGNPAKVLVVDDSALIRKLLTEILAEDRELQVVGSAADPFQAREKIKQLEPDVITLDVEMPRMDGITFLRNLMRLRPMPVLMISSLTERGADVTLAALELGAFDFVTKPKLDVARGLEEYSAEIVRKVKAAARSTKHLRAQPAAVAKVASNLVSFKTTDKLIAIGASTGGTEAIKDVLERMPANSPAIVITQHIPALFSKSFAKRMDASSQMTVFEAEDGMQVRAGHVYIAPGDRHLLVMRDGARWRCKLDDGEPVNRHKPSVDVMFDSVARAAGRNAIGVILTGMGNDGARGLKAMHEAGAPTIAQDEKSSVVWGMPGEAVKAGGVDQTLPLDRIAGALSDLVAKL